MSDWNPFEVIAGEDGELSLAGAIADKPMHTWRPDQLWTVIAVGTPEGPAHPAVARLPGLWEPDLGSVIQLSEPNRDARVYRRVYAISPAGFTSIVYVEDSMGPDDFREPRTYLGPFERAFDGEV